MVPTEDSGSAGLSVHAGLGRALWRIAWPVVLMQALYTTMNIVDMFWVGKLGHVAVAAVAMCGTVLAVMFSVGQVFATATVAMAARAFGAGDRAGAADSTRHALLLAVCCALPLAAAGAALSAPVLRLFGSAAEVVANGAGYLALMFGYLPLLFAGMVVYSLFQAMGDTRTPMMAIVATNVLNIVLDPILIFGWFGLPRLGVFGAGVATVSSQVIWLAAMAVVLARRRLLPLRGRLRPGVVRAVFAVGVPAGLQVATRPVTGMIMFGIVNSFGTAAAAAFGIGLRILQFMYIYLGGLGSAAEALVGQSLGAGLPARAARVGRLATLIATLLQLGIMPLVFVFAPGLVKVFSDNPQVVQFGTSYLRVLAPVLILVGASIGWASAQRGAGATGPPMLAAVIANWPVKIAVAWFLAYYTPLGLAGVWVGIGVSILVESALLAAAYYRGGWQKKELVWH